MRLKTGMVYLVGAGPGDPGLLTLRGRECIAAADILVYDYLAGSALLNMASRAREVIYVGKKAGQHTMPQSRISALLVEKARKGWIVTRLKGGDPFVFGRGGEEAEVLVEAGVPFEVVPGVTSAVAAPAYAGIPLTHRRMTSTVAFVTGHEAPDKAVSTIDYKALATGIGTIVFLMGVKNLPHIVAQLRRHGMPGERRAALVQWGTTPRQRTVEGTVDTIVQQAAQAGITSPAVIVVGDVVALRASMNWYERRPLMGKRILVTRARAQASDLTTRLTSAGAVCLECPTIEVMPPSEWGPLDAAIRNFEQYHWLIFTSVNAVQRFFDRLFALGYDARRLAGVQLCAIGPATARRMADFGLICDIVPETYRAESVVAAFDRIDMRGKRVLLPRAEAARPVLPAALSQMGADVDVVVAYRTVLSDKNQEELLRWIDAGEIDCLTFTSSSTVKNLMQLLSPPHVDRLLSRAVVAAIGPITAQTAAGLGLRVDIVAETYTIPGLCAAIMAYYA